MSPAAGQVAAAAQRRRRWPLGVQLALSFFLVAAAALGGGGLLLVDQVTEAQLADRSSRLLAQANAAGNLVAEFSRSGDPQGLELALYRFHQQTGVRAVAVDAEGKAVADSVTPSPLIGQRLTHPELAAALKGNQVTGPRWLTKSEWVMYGAVPVWESARLSGAVLVAADISSINETLTDLMHRLALAAATAGALAVVLGLVLARYLAAPLENLSRAARSLAGGQLAARVQPGGSREVAALGQSFNRMAAELGQMDEQRRAFVADASHELRTPVAAMRALAEGLLADRQGDIERWREYLGDIVHESERAARLIDRLLELARLDARQQTREGDALHLEDLNLRETAQEIVHALRPLAEERGLSLELDAPQPLIIRTDSRMVEAALGNLVENGVKYTPAGGQVRVQITRREGAQGPEAVVRVEDTGPGIPTEHLPHIFERFYRVDKARSRSTGGAGLGLSIAAEAAQLLGGRIEVNSEVGRGARFELFLPM